MTISIALHIFQEKRENKTNKQGGNYACAASTHKDITVLCLCCKQSTPFLKYTIASIAQFPQTKTTQAPFVPRERNPMLISIYLLTRVVINMDNGGVHDWHRGRDIIVPSGLSRATWTSATEKLVLLLLFISVHQLLEPRGIIFAYHLGELPETQFVGLTIESDQASLAIAPYFLVGAFELFADDPQISGIHIVKFDFDVPLGFDHVVIAVAVRVVASTTAALGMSSRAGARAVVAS